MKAAVNNDVLKMHLLLIILVSKKEIVKVPLNLNLLLSYKI
jgi:hypothetical protein